MARYVAHQGEWKASSLHRNLSPPGPAARTPSLRKTSPLHDSEVMSPGSAAAPSTLHAEQRTPALAPSALPADQVRAPRASKKVTTNPDLDEIKAAVERDAQRKEAKKAASRSQSTPRDASDVALAALSTNSPPSSPSKMASSTPKPAVRADPSHIMARTGSIDSTVSAGSIPSASQHKHNASAAYRVSPESAAPQDIAQLIATAGSPDAAITKLIAEKNTAASHNAQLWRLVEKQRAMILGLNKDLEKALKEKERYRRKLKENLAQSQSAPSLPTVMQEADATDARDVSLSPAAVAALPPSLRDGSLDSRKFSDASDVVSVGPGRSDTPQDAGHGTSSGLPATPLTGGSTALPQRTDSDASNKETILVQSLNRGDMAKTFTPPLSPRPTEAGNPKMQPASHKPAPLSLASPASPPGTAQSFSSPKQATRKAPPAPLQLSPQPVPNITNNILDPSDSEYEEEPESARAEKMRRGRRKTREEDDREREVLAQRELEHRSKSMRDKKSKSKSKPPAEGPGVQAEGLGEQKMEAPSRRLEEVLADEPAAILRSRAASDAAGMLQRTIVAPSIMSPGLPMSPRPGDRPMNSPLPRAPMKAINSIPMSPRTGLPLSPRAPTKAIPLPPQTPLSFASPHLARANNYHEQMTQNSSIGDRLKPPRPSPERERSIEPKSPGEIYRGLVSEQYPDLLMPPNALPSIYVKVASSRMRPSRNSYMAPKNAEENPVFTVGVHARSDNKQLWRVEKTLAALTLLDQQIKIVCAFRDRVPDKTLFAGHAPAKIDARRSALDTYFEKMLDSVHDEKAARVVCKFLSTDAFAAEGSGEYFGAPVEAHPDSPMMKGKARREGYLTKRGKNFGGWKVRYFVLDGPQLKYFESPGGAHLGSIKLLNAQIGKQSPNATQASDDEDNQFRHAFLILEPKRKDSTSLVRHVLCAESDDERDAWVDVLLAYVDFADAEDASAVAGQGLNPNIGGGRSPRLQKSLNDLRPPSRNKDVTQGGLFDPMRSIGYNETIAGDAPVMGLTVGNFRGTGTPSPPHNGEFSEHAASSTHPMISAPTNAHVISNAGEWGMKPPPTPSHAKDKKRSIFAGFRGRSSSDLDTKEKVMSPGFPSPEFGVRAVFGAPLAEAVEYAHPVGATTGLPAVVYRCIEYLIANNAIAEEGIFRLSGSNTVIKGLRERFNTEGDVNLTADGKYYDVHAVASLLKLYLRELPSSILTRDLHIEFLSCLETPGRDKIVLLNNLVHKLPKANYELLKTLSEFLLSIVNNADVNKMNVRNVGIVFSPTLNVPAPLISSFVEDQAAIFGAPADEPESPISDREAAMPAASAPADLRSPRKQMFTDLPTPAYNQTSFQSYGALHSPSTRGPQQLQQDVSDTGFAPLHPTYAGYQVAQHGDAGYGSLNNALAASPQQSPTVYTAAANGTPTPRDVRQKRRESGMHMLNLAGGLASPTNKSSMSRLNDGGSF